MAPVSTDSGRPWSQSIPPPEVQPGERRVSWSRTLKGGQTPRARLGCPTTAAGQVCRRQTVLPAHIRGGVALTAVFPAGVYCCISSGLPVGFPQLVLDTREHYPSAMTVECAHLNGVSTLSLSHLGLQGSLESVDLEALASTLTVLDLSGEPLWTCAQRFIPGYVCARHLMGRVSRQSAEWQP